MEKHSLWATLLTVLANLVSKFVTDSRIVIRDSATGASVKCSVSSPFKIKEANISQDGNINLIVGKENIDGKEEVEQTK